MRALVIRIRRGLDREERSVQGQGCERGKCSEQERKETRKLVLPFCFDFFFHVPFNRLLNVLSLPFFYCIIYDLLHKEASVSVDGRLRTAGPW